MILKVIINTLVSESKDQNFIYGCLAGIASNYPKMICNPCFNSDEMIPAYFENDKGYLPKEYKLTDKRCKYKLKIVLAYMVLIFNACKVDEEVKLSIPKFISAKYSYVLKKLNAYIPVVKGLLIPRFLIFFQSISRMLMKRRRLIVSNFLHR